MSGTTEIRAALIARLVAASPGAAIPSASVAWENKKYTAGTARWYRCTFLPGIPRAAAIGVYAENRHVGIFQIDIFEPSNLGDVAAVAEAERIASCYKRGTALANGGVTTQCEKAYRTRGDASDPAWYMISVVVEYAADTAN